MDEERLAMIIKNLDFDVLTDGEIAELEQAERVMAKFSFISDKSEQRIEKIWEKYR